MSTSRRTLGVAIVVAALSAALSACGSTPSNSLAGDSGQSQGSGSTTTAPVATTTTTAPSQYNFIGSVTYQYVGATLEESYAVGQPVVIGSSGPPSNAPPSSEGCGLDSQDDLYLQGQVTLTLTGSQSTTVSLEPYYDMDDVAGDQYSGSDGSDLLLAEDIEVNGGWDCAVSGGNQCGCGSVTLQPGEPVTLPLWFESDVAVVNSSNPNFSSSQVPQEAVIGWAANPTGLPYYGSPSGASYAGPNATSGCTTQDGQIAGILLFSQTPVNLTIPSSVLDSNVSNDDVGSTLACSGPGSAANNVPEGLPAPLLTP